jgi:hypothetical protein
VKRFLPLLGILPACSDVQLSQSWQIDRMRILAVRASVLNEDGVPTTLAEPQPGDTVQLASLTVHPEIDTPHVIWTGCLRDDSSLFGCIPEEGGDGQKEDGFLGIEPFMPPQLVIPEDVLDDLTEEEKNEGISYLFTLLAVPDVEEIGENLDPEAFSNDEEIATKSMPISLAETPNNNPFITQLLVEKNPIPTGTTLTVIPGQAYHLEPVLTFGPEEYVFINRSGERELRIEEPYYSFYATEGSFDRPYSDYGDSPGVNWTAPREPNRTEARLWVVVRDRRGGMGWIEQVLLFE